MTQRTTVRTLAVLVTAFCVTMLFAAPAAAQLGGIGDQVPDGPSSGDITGDLILDADGSGGEGRHEGGDGIVRAFVVLEDGSVSFLTDRRETAPKGAEGGGDGATGVNLVGDEEVGARAVVEVEEGTRVEVRTPGGGGYGASDDDNGDG